MKPLPPVARTTSPPISLEPQKYWKLRALLKDAAALPGEMQAVLERQQAELQQRIHAAMTEAGLDPKVVYRLTDADLTAVPQ